MHIIDEHVAGPCDAELEFWPFEEFVVEVAVEQGGVSAVVAQGYVMRRSMWPEVSRTVSDFTL